MAGFSFDGRFGCGPSKIRLDQLQALSAKNSPIGTSHRRPPVRDLVKEIQDRFRALYNLPEEYEVVLGNGGASAFWDMIVFSLVRSKVSASRFGEFGGKFIKEAQEAPFVEQVFVNEVEVGSAAYPQANLESGVADLFAYPHNETSTGAMLSPKRIWGLDNGQVNIDSLTVVDGTSAAGGVFFDVKETDVYYFSLQKNLGSEGGLWIAFLSPKAIDRSSEIVQYRPGSKYYRWIPDFLSLSKAIENSYKNQTLNTPSISTLILLNEQLKYIEKKGGIQWADQHTKELSDYLYSWADRNFLLSAFVEPQYRSQTVVTIDIDPRINVEDLLELASQKGVKDIFAYRSLKRNQIRIACFTSIDFDDLKKLTNILDQALKQLSE